MERLFGLTLFSFFFTCILVVPFIDLLYKMKFRRRVQKTVDQPLFNKLHNHKAGTPVGGGLLVILVTVVLSFFILPLVGLPLDGKFFALITALLGFGALGLYDDFRKFFNFESSGVWGLRMRQKFLIQWIIALVIGCILYYWMNYDNLYITGIGNFDLGEAYIFFAAFVIVAFSNAVNITDGLDGLAGGLLVIALFGFLVLVSSVIGGDMLINPTLQTFLGIWIGSMFALLYFNVFPARIWMGDVGALAFGAALGVVALLTAKVLAMVIISGVFVIEIATSAIQIVSKRYRKKKVFQIAPLHLWLQAKGWEEPKIVMRFWLIGAIFAMLGVWLATIR